MKAVDRVHRVIRQVPIAKDAQRHQCRDALPIGRDFVQIVAPIGGIDGLHPVCPMGGKIGGGHRAPLRCAGRRDLFGEISAIKRFAFGLRDTAQRLSLIGEAEQFTWPGRAAARHEGFAESRLISKPVGRIRPLFCDHWRDKVTPFRVFDRRLEQVRERQSPETLRQRHPAGNRTRYGYRVPAFRRHRVAPGKACRRPGGRGAAGGVQPVQLAFGPYQRKGVAADAVHRGLHHGERDGSGNGGVDRVAAFEQHAQPRLRSQWLRSRDDVPGKQRAALRRVGKIPTEGHLFKSPGRR